MAVVDPPLGGGETGGESDTGDGWIADDHGDGGGTTTGTTNDTTGTDMGGNDTPGIDTPGNDGGDDVTVE